MHASDVESEKQNVTHHLLAAEYDMLYSQNVAHMFLNSMTTLAAFLCVC